MKRVVMVRCATVVGNRERSSGKSRIRSNRIRCRSVLAPLIGSVLVLACVMLAPSHAYALPSFARQTGQRCPACHTNFPELTPFGRLFKLSGYTFGGGESKIPPFSAMVQTGFTHTRTAQPDQPAPGFGVNDNVSLEAVSLFYAGRLFDGVGAFVQVTYSDTAKNTAWDNTDIRFARGTNLFDHDFIFGIDLNNNPTVQDVYNTTPAFNFPYASGSLAPKPAAATRIEGGFAQQVGGLGGYTLIDDTVYAEFSLYRTLPNRVQRAFGISTDTESEIDGVAPYWRVALQHQWGDHFASVGTFGLVSDTFPNRIHGSGTDNFADVGIDAQYQYLSGPHVVGLYGSWIHEDQTLGASSALGVSNNPSNTLNSLRLRGTYVYTQGWAKYAATVSYFSTYGSADAGLYAPGPLTGSNNGSPDTNGWIFQVDYLPFINTDTVSFWPWAQVKLSLQYIAYNKFNGSSTNYDGSGRDASANNTLFLSAWFAF